MKLQIIGSYEDKITKTKLTHSITADGLPHIAHHYCVKEVFIKPRLSGECFKTDCLDCWIEHLQGFEKIKNQYTNTLILEKRSTK